MNTIVGFQATIKGGVYGGGLLKTVKTPFIKFTKAVV